MDVYGYPESTCNWGSYDLRTYLEIKSGNFYVKSTLWTSTGEIYEFYKILETCNEEVKGIANFYSYEGNLALKVIYDNLGHVIVKGKFSEQSQFANELKFEYESDQSYLGLTLEELKQIVLKYGDMTGVKK